MKAAGGGAEDLAPQGGGGRFSTYGIQDGVQHTHCVGVPHTNTQSWARGKYVKIATIYKPKWSFDKMLSGNSTTTIFWP